MQNIHISFSLFEEIAHRLAGAVLQRGITYDGILCPLRGGYYLSQYLAREFAYTVYYLEIASYRGKTQMDFRIGRQPALPPGRYLLCDDIYDTGNTMRKIHDLYPGVQFDMVCLVTKNPSATIINGMRVDADAWVEFFWEGM